MKEVIPTVEHFSEQKPTQKQVNVPQVIVPNTISSCDNYLEHMKTCRKCRDRARQYLRPYVIENFSCLIDDNRDTIVLILIGISIMLFFNLINGLTKSN